MTQRSVQLARATVSVLKAFCSCDLARKTYRGKVNWVSRCWRGSEGKSQMTDESCVEPGRAAGGVGAIASERAVTVRQLRWS